MTIIRSIAQRPWERIFSIFFFNFPGYVFADITELCQGSKCVCRGYVESPLKHPKPHPKPPLTTPETTQTTIYHTLNDTDTRTPHPKPPQTTSETTRNHIRNHLNHRLHPKRPRHHNITPQSTTYHTQTTIYHTLNHLTHFKSHPKPTIYHTPNHHIQDVPKTCYICIIIKTQNCKF